MNEGTIGKPLTKETLLLFRIQNGNYSVFRLRRMKPLLSKLLTFLFIFCGHWNKLLLFKNK